MVEFKIVKPEAKAQEKAVANASGGSYDSCSVMGILEAHAKRYNEQKRKNYLRMKEMYQNGVYKSEKEFVNCNKSAYKDYLIADGFDLENPSDDYVEAWTGKHGSIKDDLVYEAPMNFTSAESSGYDEITVDEYGNDVIAPTKEEKEIIKEYSQHIDKCLPDGLRGAIQHQRGSHVFDAVIKREEDDAVIGRFSIDPRYMIPGKVSVIIPTSDGKMAFIPMQEHDLLQGYFSKPDRRVTEKDRAYIIKKYMLPSMEVYKYVDVSKIKLQNLSMKDKKILSDNLTMLVEATKKLHKRSDGARYRFTKFYDVNNFRLISDEGVTAPYAGSFWYDLNSKIIDNTSASFSGSELEIKDQSGSTIYNATKEDGAVEPQ